MKVLYTGHSPSLKLCQIFRMDSVCYGRNQVHFVSKLIFKRILCNNDIFRYIFVVEKSMKK